MKNKNSKVNRFGLIMIILLIVALCIVLYKVTTMKLDVDAVRAENEQLLLTNEQLQLSNEYEAINSQFAQYEDQAMRMEGDTILAKYNAAKTKIEQLISELNSEKKKSHERIAQLQTEISSLRGILHHYITQVDSLGKENEGLRAENEEFKTINEELSTMVEEVTKANATLSERISLAEKLNISALTITPVKRNGREEKNVTKAYQLMVTFTVNQNNSAPVGNKTLYMRITSPEGALLGNGGTFTFDDSSVPCTAKKNIEYTGEEMPGVKIFWDVNKALTPGEYTVELFADNYRIASRSFTLNK